MSLLRSSVSRVPFPLEHRALRSPQGKTGTAVPSWRTQSAGRSTGPAGPLSRSGRSARIPMSSTAALKTPVAVRSVSSRPWPTSCRPV